MEKKIVIRENKGVVGKLKILTSNQGLINGNLVSPKPSARDNSASNKAYRIGQVKCSESKGKLDIIKLNNSHGLDRDNSRSQNVVEFFHEQRTPPVKFFPQTTKISTLKR